MAENDTNFDLNGDNVTDIGDPVIVDTEFGRASTRNDATSCPIVLCDEAYFDFALVAL